MNYNSLKSVVMKILVVMICLILSTPVFAGVEIFVHKSKQTMDVFFNKTRIYSWKVSTGRPGFTTPSGVFTPYSLQKMHFSRKYHMSPMPYSIFIKGGYAIHATNAVSRLGHRASHGCVRISPNNAKTLFNIVTINPTKVFIVDK